MTYPGKKKRGLRAWEAGFSNSRYGGPSLGRCTCPFVRWPADVGCSMNGRKAVCRPGVLHFRPSKNKLQLIDVTVPSHNVVFTKRKASQAKYVCDKGAARLSIHSGFHNRSRGSCHPAGTTKCGKRLSLSENEYQFTLFVYLCCKATTTARHAASKTPTYTIFCSLSYL